jgi:hypothetical protein
MNLHRQILITTILLLALVVVGCGPDGSDSVSEVPSLFGELPPGALSIEEMGETDELVVWMVFDPALVLDEVPVGLRLQTLGETEARDPIVAAYLDKHPEHRDWTRGVYEIMTTASLRVDDREARLGPRGGLATWFAFVEATQPVDSRPHGSHLLTLAAWVSDREFAEYAAQKGYPWDGADIDYWVDDQGVVHGRLQTEGVTLEGWCKPSGEPIEDNYDLPAYQTLWAPRSRGAVDEFVTFYGHKYQACESAEWKVEGDHLLARAFRSRGIGGEQIDSSEFLSDYFLRGGLYQRP